MTDWLPLARVEDVAEGRVLVFPVGDHDIALCNVEGQFYAVDDVCTHDGGALDQGYLEGNEIECPRHGARFDVRNGAVTQMPAFQAIETHAVRVEDGAVQVAEEHK